MTCLNRSVVFSVSLLAALFFQSATAQSVLDPNDPVIDYNPASPPAQPPWMTMGKWVRTPRGYGDWTNRYKAYIWQGLAFRLRFPNGYNPANTVKKYPLIIFLHGKGEISTQNPNYDNEFQLLQGPPQFDHDMNNPIIFGDTTKSWNGYVLAPQVADLFYLGDFERVMQIVDYMIANNNVDPFRITIDGLSSGGWATWQLFNLYPKYISSLTPISSPVQNDIPFFPYDGAYIANKKFTPIWNAQGGVDVNPTPAVTQQVEDTMKKYGANYKRTVYPGVGHGTWFGFWAEPDFWPFVNRTYMSNPWMLGGPIVVWPGQSFNKTIGVQPGFDNYQWRRNGVVLPGQNSNTLTITSPGVYDARVLKGTLWSDWSWMPLRLNTTVYQAENYTNSSSAVVNNFVPGAVMSLYQSPDTVDRNKDGFPTGTVIAFNNTAGAWLEYAINPIVPGQYDLSLRVAGFGGQVQVRSGSTILATVNLPFTGSFDTWTTITTPVTLTAGAQTLRLTTMANTGWFLNSFQFALPAGSTLPVKYEYFNSQCDGGSVNLQWKTSLEQNALRYSVQRSSDGRSWIEIGSVAAQGQSNQQRSYSFHDRGASSNSLYRIVEYDYSGQTTISSVVRGGCSLRSEITLYPNPASSQSAVNITLDRGAKVSVRVLDSKGAMVQQMEAVLPQGNSSIPLNVSGYAKGIYTVQVNYSGEVKTLKLIKK
jgi:hypothetical protein